MEKTPLLPLAASFSVGIAVAGWLRATPVAIVIGAAALLAGAAVLLWWKQEWIAVGVLLTAVAALGALSATPLVPADHIARHFLPVTVVIEGRVAEEPVRWNLDRTRLLLDVQAYQDGADWRPASGQVQLTIYGDTAPLGEGQRIRAEVRLHRPVGFRNPGVFDYLAHLRRTGILLVGNGRGDRVTALTDDRPPWPVAVRRWSVATVRAELPESSAALLAGLLLGERTALPSETDEAFRRAGVYHLLAVSGFNVALLASSVFACLSLVGVARRATAAVAALVLVAFALVVGGQPSVLRATVMGLLVLGGIVIERESQLMNALSLAALALLAWAPADLWDPGFQLSFAATAGIVYLASPLTEFLRERGSPGWLAAAVAVSLGAQLPVTPIMLAHFNQLSLIGVAANLFVVPLAGPATTVGMLAVVLHLVSETASNLAFNALWLILMLLRVVVWAAAAVPAAMVHMPAPSWAAAAAWYGALVLVPDALAGRRRYAVSGLALAAVMLSVWPWLPAANGRLRITFLDVGQGDATFVEVPEGRRLLVDGGPGGTRRFDVGERVLSPFLWNRPVKRIDVVALTHADSDHSGGLGAVLRHFYVGEFWENGRWGPGSEEMLGALAQSRPPRHVLRAGERFWLGSGLVTVINPDREVVMPSQNDDSLVLRLDWRGVAVLLTGDLGWAGEERILERGAPLRVLALRVGHHGSRFSSSPAFLDATQPALAIISVGFRNPFRHPSPDTLARLERAGARIYRTDRDGAIILETDGARLWVTRWASRTTEVFELGSELLPNAETG